jgi:hypothetical protein
MVRLTEQVLPGGLDDLPVGDRGLQRALEIGSYPTAWAVLVRPGRDPLSGTVQVDETFIGGDEPGLAGGRAAGKKVLTGIAVEVSEPKGIGRCRMAVLADGSAGSLRPFVTALGGRRDVSHRDDRPATAVGNGSGRHLRSAWEPEASLRTCSTSIPSVGF